MNTQKRQISSCQETLGIVVHVANSVMENREIYQFRYQIFIDEMSKSAKNADHTKHVITDTMDEYSLQLYATVENEIAGALRFTIAEPSRFPRQLASVFHMQQFASAFSDNMLTEVSLCTKLAVKDTFRSSPILYYLMVKAYEIARERNVQINFGGCNPYLLSLYEQMGYRQFTKNFIDPGYGLLVPLVMLVEDIEHFHLVKSPFFRLCRKFPNNPQIAQTVLRDFPLSALKTNTQSQTRDEVWSNICQYFPTSPLESILLFTGMTQEECTFLLHCASIFHCHTGDLIIDRNEMSNELYILLAGELLQETTSEVKLIQPGNHFSGNGLPEPLPLNFTVTALTVSTLLVISRSGFSRFSAKYPNSSAMLLYRLHNNLEQNSLLEREG